MAALLQTAFHVGRPTLWYSATSHFRYGTITLFRSPFQMILLCNAGIRYRALLISLAATFRISVDFFSSRYWDVSVPMVRFSYLCIQYEMTLARRVSPFGYHSIIARLPAPLCFSQAPTSFFASYCQGIHPMHLFAWSYNLVYFCFVFTLGKSLHLTQILRFFILVIRQNT